MKRQVNAAIMTFTIFFAAIGVHCQVQAQNASATSTVQKPATWEGIWVAERNFGPRLHGPVSVYRYGEGWVAEIQGETVPAEMVVDKNGSVDWSFSFFNQGRFVGRQTNIKADIEGHWVQSAGMVQYYPLASPVRLKRMDGEIFDGLISPLPQEVSLNIPLSAEGVGDSEKGRKYRTFLRNPQANYGVYFRIESAKVVGDEIQFANANGEILAVGQIIEPGERFTLLFPRFGETFDFTKRARDDAPGFYPRRSLEPTAQLSRPPDIEDGWKTALLRESGIDERLLTRLVSSISVFKPTGLRQPYIHNILIAHRGKLVVEEYFHGRHRGMTHDSRSAGKSLTSALLGIAIQKGMIANVDELVYPFFGGVDAFANPDPRKERLTIRNLVTMSPGFACDDGDYDSPGNEDVMQEQNEQPDWYRYTLNLPMKAEPGEVGVYCTGGMNLIGGIIQMAAKSSMPRFFHEEFAKPLGISNYQMNLSPDEQGYMGGGIRLRPRDFLKLGQLYLDEGMWDGRRIVSEQWVRESAASHASLNVNDDYGYGWWRQSYEVQGRSIETYYASGNGGQLLFVVPELDLVVQINAGNYGDGRTRNQFRDQFMKESILPAVLAAE